MASGGLTSQSLTPQHNFDWVFLVELLVCGILTLFFLFYFNRLFATLISYGLRAYTWHKYRSYIDIQALQVSLLGGRIFVKGVRYHGHNETIIIQSGHVTWQYWQRKVREVGYQRLSKSRANERPVDKERVDDDSTRELSSRFVASLQGVEWFVYNRTPAYDTIAAQFMERNGPESETVYGEDGPPGVSTNLNAPFHPGQTMPGSESRPVSGSSSLLERPNTFSTSYDPASGNLDGKNISPTTTSEPGISSGASSTGGSRTLSENAPVDTPYVILLKMLPVHIQCKRAAIVMGNENTKSVLTIKFEAADGDIDATSARSVDQFKQLFNFRFSHPVVQMKPNITYKEPQLVAAARLRKSTAGDQRRRSHRNFLREIRRQERKLWHTFRDLVPLFQRSVESLAPGNNGLEGDYALGDPLAPIPGHDRWLGLTRYLDDDDDDQEHSQWSSVEYGKFSTIIDCPRVDMSFYWDVPGQVPEPSEKDKDGYKITDDINGDTAPEWGLDLSFKGKGTINYGPWADRQRADLQTIFFPRSYKDSEPAKSLLPGQARISTAFKLLVELEDEMIVRIPIREQSKDWKWKGLADAVRGVNHQRHSNATNPLWKGKKSHKGVPGPDVRPFGWLDFKIMGDSTLRYAIDMVAGQHGFASTLSLDLHGTELSSSVNHGLLWRSKRQTVSCDLGLPLKWNGLHDWRIDITSEDLELFLLREHVFLITDLITDWSTGPPPDYYTFSPFKYTFGIHVSNLRFFLNVNDSNIINDPSDLDSNTFVCLGADKIAAEVAVPQMHYRPTENDVSFKIDAFDLIMELHLPPWNTQHLFLDSKEVAKLQGLVIDAQYHYHTGTSSSLTDTLSMDIHGSKPSFTAYGFVIHHLIKIRENYFGDHIHFRTLEEFQHELRQKRASQVEQTEKEHHKKTNDLDVILSIGGENGSILLPNNLYASKTHIRLELETFRADLRFTNYYMDLDINFSPLSMSLDNEASGPSTPMSMVSETQLFVDGVTVRGHRLFGLPPQEPTYMCNWDFQVGSITGECSASFLRCLGFSFKAMAFTLMDQENALASGNTPLLYDVTFLRARLKPIRIWMHVDQAAFLLNTGSIALNLNDWANSLYSERLDVLIPDLSIACVNAESASRHRVRMHTPVKTHAFFETTLKLTMLERKFQFSKHLHRQQKHIKQHDDRTRRTEFLYRDLPGVDVDQIPSESTRIVPPAMSLSPMPPPIYSNLKTESPSTLPSPLPVASEDLPADPYNTNNLVASDANSMDSIVRTSKPTVEAPPPNYSGLELSREDLYLNLMGKKASQLSKNQEESPDLLRRRWGLPPTSVAFSSSYAMPYFPLCWVQPDMNEVPVLQKVHQFTLPNEDPGLPFNDAFMDAFDERSVHVSFMVNMDSGLRGFLDPEALRATSQFLDNLQSREPEEMLDALQIYSVMTITDLAKRRIRTGKTIDVNVRIPCSHFRLLNTFSVQSEGRPDHKAQDRYDAQLGRFSITTRSRLKAHTEGVVDEAGHNTVHVVLEDVSLAITERTEDSLSDRVAVSLKIQDLIFWLVVDHALSTSLQVKAINMSTSSKQVHYLTSMIHRSTSLGQDLTTQFSALYSQQETRLRHLIYRLIEAGDGVPDPVFLTRASFVFRLSDDHLRTKDSWKVMSRIRYIYFQSSPPQRQALRDGNFLDYPQCPPDAPQRVIAALNKWRTWDLFQVKQSILIRKVFGSYEELGKVQPEGSVQMNLLANFGRISLTVDPGPRQNEAVIHGTTLASCIKPDRLYLDPSHSLASGRNITIVQLHLEKMGVQINWELCELVEDILHLYGPSSELAPLGSPSASLSLKSIDHKKSLHIVISLESGTMSLDTINLKVVAVNKGFKGSLVVEPAVDNSTQNSVHLLLHAEAASSKILHHAKILTSSKVFEPGIYLSRSSEWTDGLNRAVWKLAGTCSDIQMEFHQEIIDIIEVLDSVLGDEVVYLERIIRNTSEKSARPLSNDLAPPSHRKGLSANKFTIALFLKKYRIDFAILDSLIYSFRGIEARTSVDPTSRSHMSLDFDLKGHTHYLLAKTRYETDELSSLWMPPINGRLSCDIRDEVYDIQAFAIANNVSLDATAIHTFISTLSRPEISMMVDDLQNDLSALKLRHSQLLSPNSIQARTQSKDTTFRYDVHLTLAGLDITANAPGAGPDSEVAQLRFELGCLQLSMTNYISSTGIIFELPEIQARLQHIGLSLTRSSNEIEQSCGKIDIKISVKCGSQANEFGEMVRSYEVKSTNFVVCLFAETASTIVNVIDHLQDRIKKLDLKKEVRHLRRLRKRPSALALEKSSDSGIDETTSDIGSTALFRSSCSIELMNIEISWIVGTSVPIHAGREPEDLVLSFKKIHLRTRKENGARLTIEQLKLQMIPQAHDKTGRSVNSAVLPEVFFNVAYLSTKDSRRLAFQAVGKELDLRLTSQFILPGNYLVKSIASAAALLRNASATWSSVVDQSDRKQQKLLGQKKFASILIDADFAGAVVHMQSKRVIEEPVIARFSRRGAAPQPGRYGQFGQDQTMSSTTLRSPGLAFKVEYIDNSKEDPSLNGEVKISASNNVVHPTLVPLIMDLSSSIKEIVQDSNDSGLPDRTTLTQSKFLDEDLLSKDPGAILGRLQLNIGIRIHKQEISLSCQPIARVTATARYEGIYFTINSVRSDENDQFLSVSARFDQLQASVQHVYSRESTATIEIDSMVLSFMNSKHVGGTSGISAILKISPMKSQVNVKQVQDFLIFREIWLPPEVRRPSAQSVPTSASESHQYLVQRYQQATGTGAFPWNAALTIEEVAIQLDLGQGLGRSNFVVTEFWASSKKDSDSEQNLCIGFKRAMVEGTGRLSGSIDIQTFKVRTSIKWPLSDMYADQMPLVQAFIGFNELQIKAGFDYQAFLVSHIKGFHFLMYNLRNPGIPGGDRLVGTLDGDTIQAYCTTTSASQGLALFQALTRLVQEKKAAYESSLKDLERYIKRKSMSDPVVAAPVEIRPVTLEDELRAPVSLHTDVVVHFKSIDLGAFPSSFLDNQIFKIEALESAARFAVSMDGNKIHSGLRLDLGQLRVALAQVRRSELPRTLADVSVNDVITSAQDARGGIILRVPKVVAAMQTWQVPGSNDITYTFKSSFEGKVDVGWNYARISFIRAMWGNHTKALAQRLGKPLPQSAVHITGTPEPAQDGDNEGSSRRQEKITAVVNMPLSRYNYYPLETPIIETPQLRDMGEATPPLEWIGLHRDRLPNLTHQIVIVTLLEVAREVEDAYGKILGTS